MKNLRILSLIHALALVLYVAGVACLMMSLENFASHGIGFPVLFLLIFVLSAAITGALVLGKPVLLYLEGRKKDAVRMFLYTISWLLILILLVILWNLMTY